MILNRAIPPLTSNQFKVFLPALQTTRLQNDIPVFHIHHSSVEVFRMEWIFPQGALSAPKLALTQFLPRLMALGTLHKNGVEIAESFERLGGFLDISMGNFKTTLTLHGLSKYFKAYIPLIIDLIQNANYPEEELSIQKNQAQQSLLISQKKTAYIAHTHFKKLMYPEHPILGESISAERISDLTRDDLQAFHAQLFHQKAFSIYLCGNYSAEDLQYLAQELGTWKVETVNSQPDFPAKPLPQNIHVELDESVQCTLMLAKRLFNRAHPDFYAFLFMNTILGGYFGSRLMKNIREEKGLTYGISSGLQSNIVDGIFSIKADVNKEKLHQALTEIKKEIDILKTNLVEESEMETVRNYIKGNVFSSTNTIFDIMDKYKAIHFEKLPNDFYQNMGEQLDAIRAEDVQRMANKYLNDFSTIIAG